MKFIAEYTIPYYQMKSHDCQEMKLSYDMKKERKYKWFSWYIMSEYIIVMILVCFNDDEIKQTLNILLLFYSSSIYL